jgi:gliding motility-associated-like protein
MRKHLITLLVLLACTICLRPAVYGNHLFGGEIGYRFLGSSGNISTYKVILTLYADCSSQGTSGGFATLYNGGPLVEAYKSDIYIGQKFLQLNSELSDKEITSLCPDEAGNTACSNVNNPLPGVKVFVYEGNFDIEGVHDNWRFIFKGTFSVGSSAGRSINISNIEAQDGASIMVLEAMLNNTKGNNNSPVNNVAPSPFFCVHKPSIYNLGAIDADGDLLEFSLIAAKQPGATASEVIDEISIPPYTPQMPLPVAPGEFSFSSVSGQLSFTPNLVSNCVVVNQVEEFRDGVKVGSSMRELTFVIMDNCSNDLPAQQVVSSSGANHYEEAGTEVFEICYGAAGELTFTVEASDQNGDNITILYDDLPQGATITVQNDGTVAPGFTLHWDLADLTPGNYLIYITFLDDGCPLAARLTQAYVLRITEYDGKFELKVRPPCSNQSNGLAWVKPIDAGGIFKYEWLDADGVLLREKESYADTLTGIDLGDFSLRITAPNGCKKIMKFNVSDTTPAPTVALGNDTTLCNGMPLKLEVQVQDFINYRWSTGDEGCCTIIKTAGTYTVTAEGSCGYNTASVTINYVDCNFCFWIPNAFSPNNDGVNDTWKVVPVCLTDKFKLQIFNRWGKVLFTSFSTDISWDGMFNGQPVDVGIYHYYLEATATDRSIPPLSMKGEVTVIR